MAVEFSIDTKPWETAVKEFLTVTRRDLPKVINNSAGSAAIKALMFTKVAKASNILPALKQRFFKVKNRQIMFVRELDIRKLNARKSRRKPGKIKWEKNYRFTPLAYAIIRRTKPGLKGQALVDAVGKFVGGRIASAGYLKYGWVDAIVGFGKRPPRGRFLKTHPYGAYRMAIPGNDPRALIENMAENISNVPAATIALQAALDKEAIELKAETLRRVMGWPKKSKPGDLNSFKG